MSVFLKNIIKIILPSNISAEIAAYLQFRKSTGSTSSVDGKLLQHYAGMKLHYTKGNYIEIGAATGNSCINLAKKYELAPSNCYFIEACPINFGVLKEKARGYNIFNYAVSGQSGEMSFYAINDPNEPGSSRSNSTNLASLLEKHPDKEINEIRVEARTLSDFFKEQNLNWVDFLFFNCEGAEYEIFQNDVSFLNKVGLISLDLHGRCDTFNSQTINVEKLRIFDLMIEHNFQLIGGHTRDDILTNDGHLTFLFEQTLVV